MDQLEIAAKAKELVKLYLSEGINQDWADNVIHPDEVPDDQDYEDILEEADAILDWFAQRFDTAITGRR